MIAQHRVKTFMYARMNEWMETLRISLKCFFSFFVQEFLDGNVKVYLRIFANFKLNFNQTTGAELSK